MKYLSHYVEKLQSELEVKYGVFFAFNDSQFEKGLKKVGADHNNKVTGLGRGAYVLTKNANKYIDGMNEIYKKGINTDLKENGIENIVMRELANHETQLTYNMDDTICALSGYDISDNYIEEIFYQKYIPHCKRNDLF